LVKLLSLKVDNKKLKACIRLKIGRNVAVKMNYAAFVGGDMEPKHDLSVPYYKA